MRGVFVLCAVALVACQPTGGPRAVPTSTSDAAGDDRVGAPAVGMPRTLDELVGRGQRLAEEWQDAPVLAEVEVSLAEGAWAQARLLYLAGDADRFLTLTTEGSGFSVDRPTLATLQLEAVTAAGVESIPPFPDDAADPEDLAEAASSGDCDMGAAVTVLYATGAPVTWDGASWTSPPEWTGTVTDDAGGGALLDPVSATVTGCL